MSNCKRIKNTLSLFSRIGESQLTILSVIIFLLTATSAIGKDRFPNPAKGGFEKLSPAQTTAISVTGRVSDADGNPLGGANVIVKGQSTGVTTNGNGDYQIEVPDTATVLIFSHTGYSPYEEPVKGRRLINVTLFKESQSLTDVVVVGYGTQKKVNLTGAVATVSAKELEGRPITSLGDALAGVVPNLSLTSSDGGAPGSSYSWNIRGRGSISGMTSDAPLIIIDGVPGNVDNINPADIENISVLKDAAASAIYGSRAPYGVVVITTKKGKSQQMKVTYTNNLSLRSPTNGLNMMGSIDFLNYQNKAATNSGLAPYFPQWLIDSVQYNVDHPEDYKTMLSNPQNPQYFGWYVAVDTDWWDELYKDQSFTQNHNLSASGGNERVNYYTSFGYLNQGGLFKWGNDRFERYSGLVNLNAKATNWLDIRLRTQVTRNNTDNPNSPTLRTVFRYWPIYPIYDPNGNYFSIPSEIQLAAEGGRINQVQDYFSNTLALVARPFKGLSLNADFTFNSGETRLTTNNKVLYNYDANGEIAGFATNANQSYINKQYNMNKYYAMNLFADYTKQLGNHNIHILTGYQQEYNHFYMLSGFRNELISEQVPALNAATGSDIQAGDNEYEWATQGVFGRIGYNFKEKYLLEINARYDGSSRFPSAHRWGVFPSVSVGYNIAKEAFFDPLRSVVSLAKIRVSYGRLGNANVNANYFMPTMNKAQTDYIGADGALMDYVTVPGFGNYQLTWEKPTMFNLGLDLSLFQNKLELNVDWFKRITSDMIGPSEPLPATLGAVVPLTNNTKLKGTGLELAVAYRNRIGKVGYSVTAGFATQRQEVLKYYNTTGLYSVPYKGKQWGEIWGLETAGFINTEDHLSSMPNQSELSGQWGLGDIMYRDQNGDGKISRGLQTVSEPGDFKVIGNTTPKFTYNFSLNANYKGFDFRAFFIGIGHADWWPEGWVYGINTNYAFFGSSDNRFNHVNLVEHLDYWTPENTDAYYPRPLAANQGRRNRQVQTKYLQNRAYLRMKNLQIGYTIPTRLLQQLHLGQLRLYVSGENLFTITKLRLFDPEDTGLVYPLQKVYSFGLNVSF
ncbi:MAG: TonB-dependent receptor [Agriterribacter sp.]